MKISNETKVGILSVASLVILVLGFNFLKGKNILNKSKKLYAIFPNIGTLDKSNAVKIKGFPIGSVYQIDPLDKNLDGIIVTINWTKDINIPRNSYATISSTLLGTTYLSIEMPPEGAHGYLTNGDTILTKQNAGVLGDLTSQVTPTLGKARTAIDSLTAVLASVNRFLDPNTKDNVQMIVAHLLNTSASLAKLMDAQNGIIAATMNNLNDVASNLKKNNDTISSMLHNANMATKNLAQLKLQQTMDSIRATVSQLNQVVSKFNHNNGSLGLLLNDRKLYDNLNSTALGMEILVDDIRAHPKRYVNISVFGRKEKGNYLNSPLKKDTLPSDR
jgi:phospholipid/cholesterol/gamma-HCH transport system substrate-binding protein